MKGPQVIGATMAVLALGAMGLAPIGGAARAGTPASVAPRHGGKLTIVAPRKKSTLTGPKVTIEVKAEQFTLVAAGSPLKGGEGHLHFFIDVPAKNVKVGAMIPLDTTSRYVHAGKEPYDRREIALAPGRHRITVVAANSAHLRLAEPKPVSVTFTVK